MVKNEGLSVMVKPNNPLPYNLPRVSMYRSKFTVTLVTTWSAWILPFASKNMAWDAVGTSTSQFLFSDFGNFTESLRISEGLLQHIRTSKKLLNFLEQPRSLQHILHLSKTSKNHQKSLRTSKKFQDYHRTFHKFQEPPRESNDFPEPSRNFNNFHEPPGTFKILPEISITFMNAPEHQRTFKNPQVLTNVQGPCRAFHRNSKNLAKS